MILLLFLSRSLSFSVYVIYYSIKESVTEQQILYAGLQADIMFT